MTSSTLLTSSLLDSESLELSANMLRVGPPTAVVVSFLADCDVSRKLLRLKSSPLSHWYSEESGGTPGRNDLFGLSWLGENGTVAVEATVAEADETQGKLSFSSLMSRRPGKERDTDEKSKK